jgi:GT2 family glycosyltransferase
MDGAHEERLIFSVVITTYNRPGPLASCLEALSRLDYPKEAFEVIVVDDGGRQRLDAVVHPFRQLLDVKLIRRDHGGAAQGRNTGAVLARGRYLAFTDDDCCPAPGWLRSLESGLKRDPAALVGGRTANALGSNLCSAASQLIVDIVYEHYNPNPENARFFASNNMALDAGIFRGLGGFDEGFVLTACEDRDLCERWRHQGHRLRYAPDARVDHYHRLSFASFCRQQFTYGRGAVRFHRLRARRGSGRLWREVGFHFHVGRWLLRPFRETSGPRALALAALLVVWQVVNAAGYFYERLRRPCVMLTW